MNWAAEKVPEPESDPEFATETRFSALAAKGSVKAGLAILDKLDKHHK